MGYGMEDTEHYYDPRHLYGRTGVKACEYVHHVEIACYIACHSLIRLVDGMTCT